MGSRNSVDSQNHRKEEKTFLQENGVDLMIRVHDTGIGMAITDQLVQLMGGEIVVESLKDKGSDFTVFLQLPLEYDLQKTYAAEAVKGFPFLERLQEESVKETERKIEEYSRK